MNTLENHCYHKNQKAEPGSLGYVIALGLAFLCFGQLVHAWSPWDLIGPSVDDIGFSYTWRHATREDQPRLPSSWHVPPHLSPKIILVIQATLKNNSSYYLTNVEFECNFYDSNHNRLEKNEKFNSALRSEKGDIAPGNSIVWTFESYNSTLSTASNAECKLTRAIGNK